MKGACSQEITVVIFCSKLLDKVLSVLASQPAVMSLLQMSSLLTPPSLKTKPTHFKGPFLAARCHPALPSCVVTGSSYASWNTGHHLHLLSS